MKAFDDKELSLAGFVMSQECKEWKIVKHDIGNVHAVRSCGRLEKFGDVDAAGNFIEARGVECLIRHLFT